MEVEDGELTARHPDVSSDQEDTSDVPSLQDLLRETANLRYAHDLDLSSTPASSYLDRVVSLPLDAIHAEPDAISAETSTVESELTNLCYRDFSTFTSVHKCSASVQSSLDGFAGSLARLLDSFPFLETECHAFVKRTHGLSLSRNQAMLVQAHQDKVSDLLEIPHLMETCVRNGHYQEALELAGHAKQLSARYVGTDLVDDVANEIDGIIQLMLTQLLGLLREPVKLPVLVRTIGFLRRTEAIDEQSLGLSFLASRLFNLRNQHLQIERDQNEPVRYLRKYIDLYREHVYDIISQFTSLFDDVDDLVPFANLCIADLVSTVETVVPRLKNDAASMSSILVQLGYCAASFARVGLDFASMVSTPFASLVLSTYTEVVRTASDQLGSALKSAIKGAAIPADVLVSPDHRASLLSGQSETSKSSEAVPASIALIPPLAHYLNTNLSALNALRLLAPGDIEQHASAALTESLSSCTAVILDFLNDAQGQSEIPNGNSFKPKHSRTPSSPRAHLLRRNTETQLSPNIRAARRREAKEIYIVFAESWQATASLLVEGLQSNIYNHRNSALEQQLEVRLAQITTWTHRHRTVNLGQDQSLPIPPADIANLDRTQSESTAQTKGIREPKKEPISAVPTSHTDALGSASDESHVITELSPLPSVPNTLVSPQVSSCASPEDAGAQSLGKSVIASNLESDLIPGRKVSEDEMPDIRPVSTSSSGLLSVSQTQINSEHASSPTPASPSNTVENNPDVSSPLVSSNRREDRSLSAIPSLSKSVEVETCIIVEESALQTEDVHQQNSADDKIDENMANMSGRQDPSENQNSVRVTSAIAEHEPESEHTIVDADHLNPMLTAAVSDEPPATEKKKKKKKKKGNR